MRLHEGAKGRCARWPQQDSEALMSRCRSVGGLDKTLAGFMSLGRRGNLSICKTMQDRLRFNDNLDISGVQPKAMLSRLSPVKSIPKHT